MKNLIVTLEDDYGGTYVYLVDGPPKIDYPKEFPFAYGPNDVPGNNRFYMSVTFPLLFLGDA
jgi:hypothetical protein